MKRILTFILFLLGPSCFAAFTEFYVNTAGNNLNSGSTSNTTANFTYAGGTFVQATGIFTAASENPQSDGVTAGMFASIYTTSGATNATFVALITNVTTTTIQVSLTSIAGAANTVSESAAASTCKVGGAWQGPNTNILNSAAGFPFNFATGTLTNVVNQFPRYNFLAGVYPITNSVTCPCTGPAIFSGYSTTPGDGGRATINCYKSGGGYNGLTLSGGDINLESFIICSNGTSGGGQLLYITGAEMVIKNCILHESREYGVLVGGGATFVECEAYRCNLGNNANEPGFSASSSMVCVRCSSHDNPTANGLGFGGTSTSYLIDCLAYNNGKNGIQFPGSSFINLKGCTVYSNASDGLDISGAALSYLFAENCNFLNNGGYGINSSGSNLRSGVIINCGFGYGSQTNVAGSFGPNITNSAINVTGTFSYASGATPWTDPTHANFSVTSSSAGVFNGRGAFVQSDPTTTTNTIVSATVSYPPIGAAAPTNSATSSAVTTSHSFVR